MKRKNGGDGEAGKVVDAVQLDPGVEESRRAWNEDAAKEPLPEGTEVEAVEFGGLPVEWVRHPDSAGHGVFLLLHGGGFTAGSCITHRKLAAWLSKSTNSKVLVPDYRLAPEHPFPAALQDVSAVYGQLLKDGVAPSEIILGGDSAGGGLAATLLVALRDARGPLPSALVLLSPWTDLTASGDSYEALKDVDPDITRDGLLECAALYAGGADTKHPMLSPIHADLTGLPPMLVHVGGKEVMLDDSRIFAERAEKAGVVVEYEVWPDMWHVWHHGVPNLDQATEAIDKIGIFVKKYLPV